LSAILLHVYDISDLIPAPKNSYPEILDGFPRSSTQMLLAGGHNQLLPHLAQFNNHNNPPVPFDITYLV
jgi:hypothetical protein